MGKKDLEYLLLHNKPKEIKHTVIRLLVMITLLIKGIFFMKVYHGNKVRIVKVIRTLCGYNIFYLKGRNQFCLLDSLALTSSDAGLPAF